MEEYFRFLVIDHNPDGQALLARTLSRKFPKAVIQQCGDAGEAVEAARKVGLNAIVTHRVFELPGDELVRLLRAASPNVPIIMVSGIDRRAAALAAGANEFLPYDEWLNLGSVVAKILGVPGSREPWPTKPNDSSAMPADRRASGSE